MINKFTILGERCSGTNYLQNLISENFNLDITWEYGWKHFFGFNNYENSDNVLFIGIVRNPVNWLISLKKNPYHLQKDLLGEWDKFLTEEFWSFYDNEATHKEQYNTEIMTDRNIYTNERYANIFESRKVKCGYLLNDFPKKVKHFILIRYEDLLMDFNKILTQIETFGLHTLRKHECYVNINNIFEGGGINNNKKVDFTNYITSNWNAIPDEYKNLIKNSLDTMVEKRLGYDI